MKGKVFTVAMLIVFSLLVTVSTVACTEGMLETYVVRAEESADGYATIYKGTDDVKILHLTDPQITGAFGYSFMVGGGDSNTMTLIERLVVATQPDLVIITGDLVMSSIMNNTALFDKYLDLFENLGVFWAFTFGNHDVEANNLSDTPEEDNLLFLHNSRQYLINRASAYPHCLVSYGDAGQGGGEGNYFINVRDQKTDEIIYTLCLMDCVIDYENETYRAEKTPEQIAWYEKHINAISDLKFGNERSREQVVKSMVFTHVPVPEIYDAYTEAYANGNPNSNYVWGTILEWYVYGEAHASCQMFEKVIELGSTKAMFFGHEHNNDCNVLYNGVNLVFGQHSGLSHYYRMVDDFGAYTLDMREIFTYGDMRGGIMITIDGEENFSLERKLASETISYDDIKIDYEELAERLENSNWTIIR